MLTATIDSLGWTTLAIAGLGAVLLMAYGLWGDRSRGRARCPKCWYSREGAGVSPCPECGHLLRKQSHLFRDRRRWRLVALACTIAGATPYVLTKPWMRQEPARTKWIPTSILLMALPFGSTAPGARDFVSWRQREMWPWQLKAAFYLERRPSEKDIKNAFRYRTRWPAGTDIRMTFAGKSLAASCLRTRLYRITSPELTWLKFWSVSEANSYLGLSSGYRSYNPSFVSLGSLPPGEHAIPVVVELLSDCPVTNRETLLRTYRVELPVTVVHDPRAALSSSECVVIDPALRASARLLLDCWRDDRSVLRVEWGGVLTRRVPITMGTGLRVTLLQGSREAGTAVLKHSHWIATFNLDDRAEEALKSALCEAGATGGRSTLPDGWSIRFEGDPLASSEDPDVLEYWAGSLELVDVPLQVTR